MPSNLLSPSSVPNHMKPHESCRILYTLLAASPSSIVYEVEKMRCAFTTNVCTHINCIAIKKKSFFMWTCFYRIVFQLAQDNIRKN